MRICLHKPIETLTLTSILNHEPCVLRSLLALNLNIHFQFNEDNLNGIARHFMGFL